MPGMNSRIVAKGIKNEIWPLLRESGFDAFTLKTAWRHLPEQIHVVNFQSFNAYLSEGLGCTTFSFALNLGIFFRAIPALFGKVPDSPEKPHEYECHFRLKLSVDITEG